MQLNVLQSNSDDTYLYSVYTEKKTVMQFIYEINTRNQERIANDRGAEWGDVCVITPTHDHVKVAEFNSKVLQFTSDIMKYAHKEIKDIKANGGWGSMNYYIRIKE